MIPNAYKVTLLIGADHTGGKLKPKDVTDLVGMSFSGDRALVWDHVPEVEIAELSAPGTWSRAPGGPVFAFDEERCAELVRASTDDASTLAGQIARDCIDPIERYQDSPDTIDGAVTHALDYGAITSALPQAGLGVYPQGSGNDQPVLSVSLGDGAPFLFDPHDWIWPDEDAELSPVAFTVAVLAQVVERANEMIRENEARGVERPQLDHTYNGNAVRLTDDEHGGSAFDSVTIEEQLEGISGAFRVLCWLPNGGAIVGNGEQPEDVWATASAPERAA
jgi:hypothetical protein